MFKKTKLYFIENSFDYNGDDLNNMKIGGSEKKIPFEDIENSKVIGISSGASAPEHLVQNLITEIEKDYTVSIEEITVAEEKVVFKLPKELN